LAENCVNLRNRVFSNFMFVPAHKLSPVESSSRIVGAFDMAALQDTLLRLEFSQCVEIVTKLKKRIDWLEGNSEAPNPPMNPANTHQQPQLNPAARSEQTLASAVRFEL
jgi:hypothetical protein